MSSTTSTDTQLALKFYEASVKEKSPEKLRSLTSKNFQCFSTWNYGKEVRWDNVEQMIGAWKLVPWNSKFVDIKVEVAKEDTLEATHKEKPNMLDSVSFYNMATTWTFTFTDEKGERKIDSVQIATTVTKPGP